jgi:hypothetical protein
MRRPAETYYFYFSMRSQVMSCFKWSPVIASLVAVGLAFCGNIARGDDLASAPSPDASMVSSSNTAVPDKAACLTEKPACCVEQSCNGEMCINRHWIIDVSGVWLAPIQSQHFAAAGLGTLDTNANLATITEGVATTTDDSFTLTPRIALGVQGDCWGLVVRYWRLCNGDLDSDIAFRTGEGASAASTLQAETFDLEVTRLLEKRENGTMLQVSGGVRYAQLRQGADLAFSETGATGFYQTSVLAKNEFGGAGFTLALQGVRPVNCSCFNLFYSVRGSILFDANQTNYVATRADWTAVAPGHAFNDAVADSNASLFIGELQVGGQWNLALKCVPANAFVRVAFEYQYWCVSNGGYAAAYSYAGPIAGPVGFAVGESSGNTHINMVGFNIGTGLTW